MPLIGYYRCGWRLTLAFDVIFLVSYFPGSACSQKIMSVIFMRATPLRLGTGVTLKRIFGYENVVTTDVDDLVRFNLWRIVHAKCPAYQLRREVRMVLALYSSMMDALRGHWGCGWSTCWAFIISHTKLKKGESRIKLFSSSSIQIGYPSSFNCKTYTMLQPSFNYCGKKHL